MRQLVLSVFPGLDFLGRAFEEVWGDEICVVRGPDVIFGGDIRGWHVPAGRFQGVIGGPPCQAFSRLVHMVRQNGYEPKFGNLIPEFERIVSEADPLWFLMENVPDAPRPRLHGRYATREFTLNNRQCIDADGKAAVQNRVRAITWGWRGNECPPLLVETALWQNREFEYAATGGSARPHDSLGGGQDRRIKAEAAYRNGKGRMPWNSKSAAAVAELCRKQGLPEDFMAKDVPWTKEGLCKAIGNGVPMPMGRALARAVLEVVKE